MKLAFYQVDVFTDRPLTGNPLAVFVSAEGLTDQQMLAIAREMNLSETTFVFPTPDADCRVRIFTPAKEIPFAGHPIIGTAHVLYETGRIPAENEAYRFQLKIGMINVVRSGARFSMQQPLAGIGAPRSDRAAIASALGLDEARIHPEWPIQVVSTGFPALLVPLKDLDSAREIKLNLARLRDVLDGCDMIYPFCLPESPDHATVHVRGFAPFIGIPEDPATGSVAGAMGAYLAHHGLLGGKALAAGFDIEQGLEMQRPSRIHVSVQMEKGRIARIQVGGVAKTVAEGFLIL